jgi:hypothetical protein
MTDSDRGQCELSILMPCLNEAETLEACIRKAQGFLKAYDVSGEVVVADNGSSDGSPAIAQRAGARVVRVQEKGYGAACAGGIAAARGRFVVVGDADDSYDFADLGSFVEKLREGYDLVMGNRFKGGIDSEAMPFSHRYVGNPALSAIGRLFFGAPVGDFQCGLRGYRKSSVVQLDLRSTGMEYGIEVIVKAALQGMRITEVPTSLSPDGRSRPPHLHTWRDGWRFLSLLLRYSPRWLFFCPGLCLALVGMVTGSWLLLRPTTAANAAIHMHAVLYAALAVVIGFQSMGFSILTRALDSEQRVQSSGPPAGDRLLRWATMEVGLAAGAILLVFGLLISLYALRESRVAQTDLLPPINSLRLAVPAVAMVAVGLQVILASFLLGVLRLLLRTKAPEG